MNKLTIEVPEGAGCSGCPCSELINIWKFDLFCKRFKVKVGDRGDEEKCPACIKACQQYRDEHDYEVAWNKIDTILNRYGLRYIKTRKELLKALHYKKGVK